MPSIFRRLGRADVEFITPRPEPAVAAEWRLVQCQDRIMRADEICRAWLADRSGDPMDVLLDVMVALGTAPAADDVPVVPGRSS